MKYLSSAPLLLFDPADSQGAFNLGQGGGEYRYIIE
jgi:hypothetical protein